MTPQRFVARLSLLCLLATGTSLVAQGQTSPSSEIRVRLSSDKKVSAMDVISEKNRLMITDGQGRSVLSTSPGMVLAVDARSGMVRLQSEAGGTILKEVVIRASGRGLLKVQRAGTSRARSYGGTLRISTQPKDDGSLLIVNSMDMDDYIAGVISIEYPFKELEGAKAQAVVARTYALNTRGRFGSAYDVTDDIRSQVFPGLGRISEVGRRAASETTGEVLHHRGRLIDAVYSADCGGHTSSNEDVWKGDPIPYLRAREDAFDSGSPHRGWTLELKYSELLGHLAKYAGFEVVDIEPVYKDGRVSYLNLKRGDRTDTISGQSFRDLINRVYGFNSLKSAKFQMDVHSDEISLTGNGYGHGIGLCQWGAHGRAAAGHRYDEILDAYYTGITIRRPSANNSPVPAKGGGLVNQPSTASGPSVSFDRIETARPDTSLSITRTSPRKIQPVVQTPDTVRTKPSRGRVGW